MTPEEVTKILKILVEVDNGCPVCAGAACAEFAYRFPEHEAAARAALRDRHQQEFEEDWHEILRYRIEEEAA